MPRRYRSAWLERFGRFGRTWPPWIVARVPLAPKVVPQGRLGKPDRRFSTIVGQVWLRFSTIFAVFRGALVRATGLAAHWAEPSFLLAGAILSRVCRLDKNMQNRKNSREHCSDDASRASRTRKARCFPSRARLSLDFRRLGTFPDAPGRAVSCPGATTGTLLVLLGRAGDAPRRSRDAPGTVSGRSWVSLGVPGWLHLT